jgi:hypothetical protein
LEIKWDVSLIAVLLILLLFTHSLSLSCNIKLETVPVGLAVALWTYNGEMLDSILVGGVFLGFRQFLSVKWRDISTIRPQPLPSQSFPVHHYRLYSLAKNLTLEPQHKGHEGNVSIIQAYVHRMFSGVALAKGSIRAAPCRFYE